MSTERDYYAILGVARGADTETIRRAFHDLAKEWHPDIAEAPEAAARFRQLAEAYSVLTDPESRVLYDQYGYQGRGNGPGNSLEHTDGQARAENVHTEVELTNYDAVHGARPVITFSAVARCPACQGQGSPIAADPECTHCRGTGRRQTVAYRDLADVRQFTLCPVCVVEACSMCSGTGTVETTRRLRIRIPAGIEDGTQIRVRGEGHEGPAGTLPGDLYAVVRVLPAPRDWRMLRYVSFALCVIAIAALVLYVTSLN